MKKKALQELKNKTNQELVEMAQKLHQEIAKLAVDLRAGKLKQSASLGQKRSDLARVKTILKEKQL